MAAGMSPLLPESNRGKALEAEGPKKRSLFSRIFRSAPAPIQPQTEAFGRTS
jgi:hypothetical protein